VIGLLGSATTIHLLAQAPTVSSLENDITGVISKTPAAKADKTAIRDLNLKKIELIKLLDPEIKQLNDDAGKAALSGPSQEALRKVASDRQTEENSLVDSLGSWTTGLSTVQAAPPESMTSQDANCAIIATPPVTVGKNDAYSYSVQCRKATPSAVAVVGPTQEIRPINLQGLGLQNQEQSKVDSNKFSMNFAITADAARLVPGFQIVLPTKTGVISSATYYIATSADGDVTKCEVSSPPAGCFTGTIAVPLQSTSDLSAPAGVDFTKGNTLFTKAIAGVMMAGATGSNPESKLFLDFYLTAPLFGTTTKRNFLDCKSNDNDSKFKCFQQRQAKQFRDPLDTRVWAFFHPQITSVPQSNVALGDVASFNTTIFQGNNATKLTTLVQAFQMEQGLELRLMKHGPAIPDSIGKIGTKSSKSSLAMFAFGSFGVGVPITGHSSITTIYNANTDLVNTYGAPATTKFIAITENTINRFYKDFYVGLRLKTFDYDMVPCGIDEKSFCPRVKNQFPGIFDVAWGEDYSINPWTLKGPGVVRIQGDYPLPFYKPLHLFGGVYMSMMKRSVGNTAQYVIASGDVKATDPNVFSVSVNPMARDQYRIGLGLDLIELIKKMNQTKISISPISPDKPEVAADGGTLRLLVTVAGGSDMDVQWTVDDVAGGNAMVGTIDSKGNYNAPKDVPKPPQVTVTATAHADPSKSTSTEVTIIEKK
jgi:hypothetical protein